MGDDFLSLCTNPGYHRVLDNVLGHLHLCDLTTLAQVHPELNDYIKANRRRLWNRYSVLERLLFTRRESLLEKILNLCTLRTLKAVAALNKPFRGFIEGNLLVKPREEMSLNVHSKESIIYHLERTDFLHWQRQRTNKIRAGASISYFNRNFLREQLEKLNNSEPSENMDWEIYL